MAEFGQYFKVITIFLVLISMMMIASGVVSAIASDRFSMDEMTGVNAWSKDEPEYSDFPVCSEDSSSEQFFIINTASEKELHPITYDLCHDADDLAMNRLCDEDPEELYSRFETPYTGFVTQKSISTSSSSRCWGSSQLRMTDRRSMGILLGGYLYVTDDGAKLYVNLRNGRRKDNVRGYAHLTIHPFNTSTRTPLLTDHVDFVPVQNYYHSQKGWTNSDWGYGDVARSSSQSLDKGIYYITLVAVQRGSEHDRSSNTNEEKRVSVNLADELLSTSDGNHLDNNNYLETSKYEIKYRLLSEEEIITEYSELTDTVKDYCYAATSNPNPWNESLVGVVPTERTCCGDDQEDLGYVYGDLVCTQDGWEQQSPQEYCAQQVTGEKTSNQAVFNQYYIGYMDSLTSQDIYTESDFSDGCCGDDAESGCVKTYTSCAEVPEGDCENYGCQRTGEATGSVQCSTFYDKEGYCPGDCTRITFCHEPDNPRKPCSNEVGECPTDCFLKTTGCSGSFSCSDYYYSDYCDWDYENPACKGEIDDVDCSSLTTKNECSDETACTFYGFWTSDYAYVAGDNRYFCNKDYSEDDGVWYWDDEGSSDWKWWDAENHKYIIHEYNGVQFISNGQQWFYSSANGELDGSHGLPADNFTEFDYDTFDYPDGEEGFSCVNALETLGFNTFFDNDLDSPFEKVTVVNSSEYCGNSDGVCCKEDRDGEIGMLNAENFDFDQLKSECGSCSVKGTDLAQYLNGEGKREQFCQSYRFLTSCDVDQDQPVLEQSLRVRKDACMFNLKGCLQKSPYLDQQCADITYQDEFIGVGCSVDAPVCSVGEYIISKDVADDNEESPVACCLVNVSDMSSPTPENVCKPLDKINKDLCQNEYYGDWFSGPIGLRDYTCSSFNFKTNDDGACCIGGKWTPIHNTQKLATLASMASPEQFISYNHSGDSRFAECCNSYSTCYNAEQSSLADSSDYAYYGNGGILHTIKNFDTHNENDEVVDYVFRSFKAKKGNPLTITVPNNDLNEIRDFSSFDTLHFDIAYNHNVIEDLVIEASGDSECTIENINQYFTNGNNSMRWHHVRIPDFKDKCNATSSWDYVKKFKITTNNVETAVSIVLDNFYLEDTTASNTENYYCAGDFGRWVKNLDGDSDKGFEEQADRTTYGAYWYACDAQASYSWTGRRCCGDDTTKPYYSTESSDTQSSGEYYSDEDAGCFAGVPVANDMPVGYALGEGKKSEYNSLLFYKGDFVACTKPMKNYFSNYNLSFNGTSSEGELVTKYNESFSMPGTHICGPDGMWVDIDEMPKARFIASKMHDLTFTDDNKQNQYDTYDIWCSDFSQGVPYNETQLAGVGLDEGSSFINDFCTLRYLNDDGKERALIGLSLKGTSISNFLINISGHLSMMTDLETDEWGEFSERCPETAEEVSSDRFFEPCDNEVDGIVMAYNPKLKILFIAELGTDSNADSYENFNGFFKPEDGNILKYTKHIFKSFLGLFDGWFSEDTSEEYITNNVLMPSFTNSTVEWTRLYVGRRDNKMIQGLVEDQIILEDGQGFKDIYTIEFSNFATPMNEFAEQYTDYDSALEAGYLLGENKQVISIVNPEARYKTFQPPFDWRRLTTAFRIDASKGGEPITDATGDGVVNINELCDKDADGNPVFKFNQSSCHFWKPENYGEGSGNVTCNKGELVFSSCSE
ncbi:MAG: hypothetical protein ACQESE_01100 [Nanobdellota archaeon]